MATQPRQQQAPPQQRQEVAVKGDQPVLVRLKGFRERANAIMKGAPSHMDADRMERVFAQALRRNYELLECDPDSLFNAVEQAATAGLWPNGEEAVIIVRRVKGRKIARFQPMYLGIRKKAQNSGEVRAWEVKAVYEKDEFDYEEGDNASIYHKPFKGAERGNWVAVYSIVTLKDGYKLRDVMWRDQVLAIRDKYSEGWKSYKSPDGIKSTPWADAEVEMARKTIIHRHRKEVPMAADLMSLIMKDIEADSIIEHEPQGDQPKLEAPKKTNGAAKSKLAQFAEEEESPVAEEVEAGEEMQDPGNNGNDDGPDHVVDPDTGEVIEVRKGAEPEPEDDGSAGYAYQQGRAARDAGKGKVVPEKYRKSASHGPAWAQGWVDRDGEITQAARKKASERG